MSGQRQFKVRAYWEDAKGSYYSLEKVRADAESRERVLTHWRKWVRSPAATNYDRRQFKVLLDYLLQHGTLEERLAGLTKSLNRINVLSCKDYGRSVARIFDRAGFAIDASVTFMPGVAIIFESESGDEAAALECGVGRRWTVRDKEWIARNLAGAADSQSTGTVLPFPSRACPGSVAT